MKYAAADEAKIVETAAMAIRACGKFYYGYADKFVDNPEQRERIALHMGQIVRNRIGKEKGDRFTDLLLTVA